VEAIYEGMVDDAVRARRKVAEGYYKNEAWDVGRVLLTEQACRRGRGHENSSSDACR
jgi:hypothetical protein